MLNKFTNPDLRGYVTRNSINVIKLGMFATVSILSNNIFKAQATSTIRNMLSSIASIKDTVKGM